MVKRGKPCTIACSSSVHLVMVCTRGSTLTSIGTPYHFHDCIVPTNETTRFYRSQKRKYTISSVYTLSSKINLLLSVHVMSVLVWFFVLIVNSWLLIRLKLPSITASPFFSASRTRLYNSVFFTRIFSPSIATLQRTHFAVFLLRSSNPQDSTSCVWVLQTR